MRSHLACLVLRRATTRHGRLLLVRGQFQVPGRSGQQISASRPIAVAHRMTGERAVTGTNRWGGHPPGEGNILACPLARTDRDFRGSHDTLRGSAGHARAPRP